MMVGAAVGTRSRARSVLALAVMAAALVTACGATSAASHQALRRTASVTLRGSLVLLRGDTLTVRNSGGQGPVRVTFDPAATPIFAVAPATPAEVQPGSCAVAGGERDAAGALSRSTIVVGASIDDTCPAGSLPDPPASAAPAQVIVRGQVVAVGGASITVQSEGTDPGAVVLLPGARVLFFQPGDRSSLMAGSCVVVQGTRARGVVAARQIVDWPAQVC